MRKSVLTPAKLKANRSNALKSTGPRTSEGKLAVRWNATKHGIFAKSTLISGGDGKEMEEDFQFLINNLVEQYQPIGAIEHILIERIASSYWRLGRAQRAEIGELQKSLDRGKRGQRTRDLDEFAQLTANPDLTIGDITAIYTTNPEGLLIVRKYLRQGRSEVEGTGSINEETLKVLRTILHRSDILPQLENLSGTKKKKLQTLDRLLHATEARYHEREEENQSKTIANFEASMIPNGKAGRNLLRYETTIERQLYRAIRELERLQEIRLFRGSQESKEYMYKLQNKPTKRKDDENNSDNEFQGRECEEHNGRKPLGSSRERRK
jgi:hypothetical protein